MEIEEDIRSYYTNRDGHLVVITDWNEASDVSRRVGEFCDNCKLCLASSPVVSVGEITPNLKGSNLFAVGPIGIKDKEICPLVINVNLYKSEG